MSALVKPPGNCHQVHGVGMLEHNSNRNMVTDSRRNMVTDSRPLMANNNGANSSIMEVAMDKEVMEEDGNPMRPSPNWL